jgi:hypothetical protein
MFTGICVECDRVLELRDETPGLFVDYYTSEHEKLSMYQDETAPRPRIGLAYHLAIQSPRFLDDVTDRGDGAPVSPADPTDGGAHTCAKSTIMLSLEDCRRSGGHELS